MHPENTDSKLKNTVMYRQELNKRNAHNFRAYAISGLVIQITNILLQLITGRFFIVTIQNALLLGYFALLCLISHFYVFSHPGKALRTLYIAQIAPTILSILMGSYFDPTHEAITLLLLIVYQPLFILDDYKRVTATTFAYAVIAIIALYVFKSPALFRVDFIHLAAFCSAGLVFSYFILEERFNALLDYVKAMKKDTDIIEGYASEYKSSYYINLDTNEMVPYSLSDDALNLLAPFLNDHNGYKEFFDTYVDKMVDPEFKDLMLKAGQVENIKKQLTHHKTFSTIYQEDINGFHQFCEMKFVRLSNKDGEPDKVILGFAQRDNEILQSLANKQILKNYDAIYFANLNTNKIRSFIISSQYENPNIERGDFDTLATYFKHLVMPEYRETVKPLNTVQGLKDILHKYNQREFIYRVNDPEHSWKRAIVQVINRKEGEAASILVSLMSIDDVEGKNLELNDQVAKQKKELEKQQVQLENALTEARQASKAKSEFLSNMSHDIRTPMNAIVGFTSLAQAHIDNKAAVEDYLSKISSSSDHLLSLINDVLDMSRIESGKISLDEQENSLPDIFNDIFTILQTDMKKHQLHFKLYANHITNEYIYCDQLRLNQVLLNCLSNAMKFTHPDGTVILEVTQSEADDHDQCVYRFRIADNGIGMSKEFVSHLFEPFTRERTSTVSKIPGTGLGMAIAKNIVELMHGEISVESAPGKGTTILILIPFKISKDHPYNIPEELHHKRVLVADQDIHNGKSITDTFTRFDISSDLACRRQEVIEYAKQHHYDTYLINDDLGDTYGGEMAQYIHDKIDAEVPIILMSNTDDYDDDHPFITKVVHKPLFPSQLITLLSSPDEKEDTPGNEDDHPHFDNKHVLLVEDGDMNREIAKSILSDMGINVDIATDGIKAIEQFKAHDYYDLILMDIMMPRMNGLDATKEIRKLDQKIPIVAMTANAFKEDKEASLAAGMNGHLAKPINIEELMKVLKTYLK